MNKKRKTFEELIDSLRTGKISYEEFEKTIKKIGSYMPYVRKKMLEKGDLLLSKKFKGEMIYKLATKKDTQAIIDELIKYKKRAIEAKNRFDLRLALVKKKGLLSEKVIREIEES